MAASRDAVVEEVRQICRAILAGNTTPYEGAERIWDITEAAFPEEFPELDTFVYAASEWRDRPEDANIFAEGVMAAAKSMLEDQQR